MVLRIPTYSFLFILFCFSTGYGQEETHIRKKKEIAGGISPKSVAISPNGQVSAQNMMYRHSVTIYNDNGDLLYKIKDDVNLSKFGFSNYSNETVKGAPVEGAYTSDGKFLWVSNYLMEGSDFQNRGCDNCLGTEYDPGFLYKINTSDGQIEQVVKVGSVPKHLAISTNDSLLIVSNWVSSDISIIDLQQEKEVKRIHVGPHPRGVAIDENVSRAFVAIMGSSKLAVVDLKTDSVSYIRDIGKAPRSLILGANDSILYVSLNSENKVVKHNLLTNENSFCKTSGGPRSMTLSPDEKYIYVVNYFDDKFTKIDTKTMTVVAEVGTTSKPIGICANWQKGEIWIACYSGKIEIFRDFQLIPPSNENWLAYSLSLLPKIDSNTITASSSNLESDILSINTPSRLKGKPRANIDIQKHEIMPIESTCDYHIIIGAFSVAENAASKMTELISKGYSASVIKGKYNYVSIACTSSLDEAEKEKARIQSIDPAWQSAWVLEV
ncbi:MAG: hypothetical protein ACPG21_10740 [Crocinitomicaceae bacterium]